LFADTLAQQEVCVVEILEKVGKERVTVRDDRFLDALEYAGVYAFRVCRAFSAGRAGLRK
jgi:hypothetical protein